MRHFYLTQRKTGGNWYAIFMDKLTGKEYRRLSTNTTNEKQAEAHAMDWLVNGLPEPTKAKSKFQNRISARNTVFCEYLTDFWDYDTSEYFREKITEGKEPKREHPLEMKKIVKRYYDPHFGKMTLCQIDEEKLTQFLVSLKMDKGLSASTVNSTRNTAFVALRYAQRKKIIKGFDFEEVIRASGDTKQRGILEREQVEKLFKLEWRDPRSRMVNLIASQTGMRMGEIRALRVCDIQEDRINVEHSWSKADGGLKCTKNREKRSIPIIPELYTALKTYMKDNGRFIRMDNLLFPSFRENAPYDHKQINKDFYSMLAKIGITETERKERNIVFHSWRHYCAAHLAQITNRTIGMAILGHKTSLMFDHYANHIDTETFNRMTEALQKVIEPELGIIKPIPFPQSKSA
ncbi:MAG: tyrosine-type recombinase/integrase [Treponema sp.]|jgi:integrase|nr:tyrosine-type recombinase/integrase [Treponema sp.]